MNRIKSFLLYLAIVYFSAFATEIAFHFYKKTPSYLNFSKAEITPQENARVEYQKKVSKKIISLLASNSEIKSSLRPAHFFNNTYLDKLATKTGFFPLGGVPNSKTVLCDEGYGLVTYQSDRYGFRNKDQLWDEPVDWLLIGDSFTQGFCVHNGSVMSDYIISDGASAINVGMGGNGPLEYAALASTFIPVLKPSKVAIIFYRNDFTGIDNQKYSEYYLKSKFQNPYLSVATFNQISNKFYDYYLNKKFLENNLQRIINKLISLAKLPTFRGLLTPKISMNAAHTAINNTLSLCSDNECELYLVYIPNSSYWNPRDERETAKIRTWLRNMVSQLSTNNPKRKAVLIDVSDEVEKIGLKAYSIMGGHFSPDAYQIVADRLIEATQNKLQ
jgi:hypothetical protein